jgi:2-haloacid dehalogenase
MGLAERRAVVYRRKPAVISVAWQIQQVLGREDFAGPSVSCPPPCMDVPARVKSLASLSLNMPARLNDVFGGSVASVLSITYGLSYSVFDDTDKKELTEKFSTMPPHREVPAALCKLRDAGFRLFTLTDNLLEVQTRQPEHGGIADLFERRFSADGVKHHKPLRQAYAYVVRELGVEPSQLCLIACHTWDTLGAVAAGWEAALIKRVGNDVLGVGPQPQIVGDDLNDVADQIIARHRGRG